MHLKRSALKSASWWQPCRTIVDALEERRSISGSDACSSRRPKDENGNRRRNSAKDKQWLKMVVSYILDAWHPRPNVDIHHQSPTRHEEGRRLPKYAPLTLNTLRRSYCNILYCDRCLLLLFKIFQTLGPGGSDRHVSEVGSSENITNPSCSSSRARLM